MHYNCQTCHYIVRRGHQRGAAGHRSLDPRDQRARTLLRYLGLQGDRLPARQEDRLRGRTADAHVLR